MTGSQTRVQFLAGRLGAAPSEALATGLCLTATLGILMLVPLLIGGYVQADRLSLAQASALITVEVTAGLVVIGVIALRRRRLNIRKYARLGAMLCALAYFLSAPGLGLIPLIGCRIVSGMGIGLMGAAVNASVARSSSPERLYATAVFIYGGASSLLLYAIPALQEPWGFWPLFAGIGFLFVLTAVASSALQDQQGEVAVSAFDGHWGVDSARGGQIAGLLIGYFAVWIAFSMVWIFAERKASSIHMSAREIGLALSACTIVGLTGSVIAGWLGNRFGRVIPLTVGGLVLAASFYALGVAHDSGVYWAAILTYGIGYFYILPYVLGLAAELDPQGRIAMCASMVPFLSHLVSPLLGTLILTRLGEFAAMAATTAAITVGGTLLLIVVAFRARPEPMSAQR